MWFSFVFIFGICALFSAWWLWLFLYFVLAPLTFYRRPIFCLKGLLKPMLFKLLIWSISLLFWELRVEFNACFSFILTCYRVFWLKPRSILVIKIRLSLILRVLLNWIKIGSTKSTFLWCKSLNYFLVVLRYFIRSIQIFAWLDWDARRKQILILIRMTLDLFATFHARHQFDLLEVFLSFFIIFIRNWI